MPPMGLDLVVQSVCTVAVLLTPLLPDALVYDTSNPAGYPTGRGLADDFADPMIAMLTMGRVTGDGVGPHTDLLDAFTYLGVPHALAEGRG